MKRDDAQVQDAARNILEAVAPERGSELHRLWKDYSPNFVIHPDNGPEGSFIMEATYYRDVWFNHRAMRLFWVGSFVAWEGMLLDRAKSENRNTDPRKFEELKACFFNIIQADDPEKIPLPAGVPEPGIFPDKSTDLQKRATAELAIFATAWAFLHEIRHIKHFEDGTGYDAISTSKEKHAEELSCDTFATEFILEQIPKYASQENVSLEKVKLKRETGIYMALFTLTLLQKDEWDDSESHPAVQRRIDQVTNQMGGSGQRDQDVFARSAFAALRNLWPDVPFPFKH